MPTNRLIFAPDQNIFRCKAQTLVNPVNTVGVMGNGLAKQFTFKFPSLLYHYRKACYSHQLEVGKPWIYTAQNGRKVLCFPTKQDWRNPSELDWIRQGMKYLVEHYESMGITSIAIPQLGCGKGQLTWEEVAPIVVEYASLLPMDVYILGPRPR